MVEDPVDPAREREQVLGFHLEDEGLPQRIQQVTLRSITTGFSLANDLSRRRIALCPRLQPLEALDGHRQLPAK